MKFYLDAQGTDGSNMAKVMRVYEDGVRIPLSEPERDDAVTQSEAGVAAALADLRAYRDAASPTNAQTVAVVKLLCRAVLVIVKRLMALE